MADTDARQRIDAAADAGAFDETAYQGSFPPGWQDTALAPPPSLVDAPGVNPQTAFSDPEYLKREDDINKHLQALEDANAGLQSKYEASTQKMSDMVGGFAKDIEGNPPPTLEKSPEAPKERMADGMMAWMQAATVLSALAGGLARGNATVALTAFAGAVKGFTEGRREDFENHIEEWKAASQRVAADNKAKLDQYDLIMKNKKMTMDMKLSQMKIVSSMYGDEITYNLAQQKQYNELGMALTKQQQFQQNFENQNRRVNAYVSSVEKHNQLLDQQMNQDLTGEAQRYIDGVPGAGSGFRSGPSRAMFSEAVNRLMKEQNLTNDDIKRNRMDYTAGNREAGAVGARQGNIATAVRDSQKVLPLAAYANDVSQQHGKRSGLAAWNAVTNEWQVQKGDPNFTQLVFFTNSLITIYARAQSGTAGGTVEQREHARQMINPNMNPKAYAAALDAMKQDLAAVTQGAQDVRQSIKTGKPAPDVGVIGNPAGDQSGWGQMTVH